MIDRGQVGEEKPEQVQTGAGKSSDARSNNGWHSWLRDLVASIIVSMIIIIFLYQPVRVEGTSMLPVLEDQDRLFINKIAYRVGEIHPGDVVVFQYPRDHTKSYIKRVIAKPGDDLRIDRGRVYVNGARLHEPYVPSRFAEMDEVEKVVRYHHIRVAVIFMLRSTAVAEWVSAPTEIKSTPVLA